MGPRTATMPRLDDDARIEPPSMCAVSALAFHEQATEYSSSCFTEARFLRRPPPEHPVPLLQLGQPRLFLLDLLFQLRHSPVLQLRRFRVVAGALGALDLEAQRFLLLFQRPDALDRFLFLLPVRGEPPTLFLEIRQLFFKPLEALFRRAVLFLPQGLTLDLSCMIRRSSFVELGRIESIPSEASPLIRRSEIDRLSEGTDPNLRGDTAAATSA